MSDNPKPTVLTSEQARQGEATGRMRAVLTASLVLAIAAGIAFWMFYA